MSKLRMSKFKSFIKIIALALLIAEPEVIAFAPYEVGVALINVFLVAMITYVAMTLKNSFRVLRNNKLSLLENKAVNKDLRKATMMIFISSLMIAFVLIKFWFAPAMLNWWSSWYTTDVMIIWFVVIEGTAMVVLAFLVSVLLRKVLVKMTKSIKKLLKKAFILFKKAIKAMSKFWALVLNFIKSLLLTVNISRQKNLNIYRDKSSIESSIQKDSFLVTIKKATWPPLF